MWWDAGTHGPQSELNQRVIGQQLSPHRIHLLASMGMITHGQRNGGEMQMAVDGPRGRMTMLRMVPGQTMWVCGLRFAASCARRGV